jgi:hypothetical protein
LQSGNTAAALTITSATINGGTITGTALNGTLGATTPSTVAATTISGTDLTTTGNTILGNASTDTLNVGNGGLIKDASGNVGIGTASPTGKLEVSGANGSGSTTLNVTGGASAGDYGVLGIRNGTTTRGRLVGDASVDSFRIDTAGGASTAITFLTGASYTERMRLDSAGNVGIGTASVGSGYKLDVNGQILISSTTTAKLSWSNSGNYLNWIECGGTAGSNYMRFATGNAEAVRITSAGNVGIGTASPTDKLEVTGSGTTYISAVRTSASASRMSIGAGSGIGVILATDNASGAVPLVFYTGTTEKMRIDSSGNLGLGVTPSAWSQGKATEIGYAGNSVWASGNNEIIISQAAYYNAGWKYGISSTKPSYYSQSAGVHSWYTAASGTAGNAITFTQAMTLDASGRLGIGTTDPTTAGATNYRNLVIGSTSVTNNGITIQSTTAGNGALIFNDTYGAIQGGVAYAHASDSLQFVANASERMRLDSSGNLGLGVTPSAWGTANSVQAIQLDGGALWNFSTTALSLIQNAYYNGTSYIYSTTAAATRQDQAGGIHYWFTAPSGTAGTAVTYTERMRIDASGSLLVGTTSPLQSSQLTVYASPTPITTIDRTTNIGATVSCASSGTGYIQGGVRLGTEGNSGIYGYDDGASGAQGIGIFTGNNTTIAERMRIDASGNLGVGITPISSFRTTISSPTAAINGLYVENTHSTFAGDVVDINASRNATAGEYNFLVCSISGVAVKLKVLNSGNVQNANNSYGAISDIKLKENIVDTSPKLDKLLQVKIRNYNLKTDPDHKQIGVIAQELETVFPSLIEETEDKETVTKTREVDGVEEEYTEEVLTGETTKAVKYSVFVPILIKAIQEQQAMIDELKAKVAALENK